jgi:hypothetical protein
MVAQTAFRFFGKPSSVSKISKPLTVSSGAADGDLELT